MPDKQKLQGMYLLKKKPYEWVKSEETVRVEQCETNMTVTCQSSAGVL